MVKARGLPNQIDKGLHAEKVLKVSTECCTRVVSGLVTLPPKDMEVDVSLFGVRNMLFPKIHEDVGGSSGTESKNSREQESVVLSGALFGELFDQPAGDMIPSCSSNHRPS